MIDINLIKKQVKEVLEYSQNISNAKVDYLIDTWYEAKKDFINMFDNELIYGTGEKITVDLDSEQKENEINNFCDQISGAFSEYSDLISFIRRNKNDFFKNILSTAYEEDGHHIPSGIKMSKAFKEFVHNEDDLYFIQTAASRVIQESKITGYLYLSVHPLDYLSSSENNYNWRSCHALDGEYRAGNLSYMLDKSTVVCYLCGGTKKVKLPRFPESVPWNNKKWRMLLFVSDYRNALFAGRHYPFFSKNLMHEVKSQWVKSFSNGYFRRHRAWVSDTDTWSSWHDDYFKRIHYKENDYSDGFTLSSRYVPMRDGIYSMDELVTDVDNSLHYNDLLFSSCYIPYYCWYIWSDEPIHFSVGHDVKCIKCEDSYIWNHESMICDDCLNDNGYIHCGDCGEIINLDYAIYIDSEDRYVCPNCYEEYYFSCPCCGEIYHNDDAYYDEDRDAYYCRYCYNEMHGN